jgi:hypothetical protein
MTFPPLFFSIPKSFKVMHTELLLCITLSDKEDRWKYEKDN